MKGNDWEFEFASLSPAEKWAIAKQRAPTRLIVPIEVENVGEILRSFPAAASSESMEIPPTPLALENEVAGQTYALTPCNAQGDWQRFVIHVYRSGGHIEYRQHDNKTFGLESASKP